MSRRALAIAVLVLALPALAGAGTDGAGRAKARVTELARAIASANARLTGEVRNLEAADRRLAKLEEDLAAARTESDRLAAELRDKTRALADLRAAMAARDRALRDRARVLWRLHQGGWLRMLFGAATAGRGIDALPRQFAAVTYVLEEDRRWIVGRQALARAHAEATKELEQLKRVNDKHYGRLSAAQDRLESEQAARRQLIARLRGNRGALTEELERARADLSRILEHLAKVRAEAGRAQRLKGYFRRPVPGGVLEAFGRDASGKYARNGVVFQVRAGEPVLAAQDGVVLYSGWFKGYGQMLVIDHGSGLLSVYAHLQRLLRKAGENVLKNDPIAQAGETGSPDGPRLYFEIRRRGKALDPMEWIGSG
ncbi:MAG: peptidoglycan DD-metalloendopeptidase family protein [Myxococcales bacterium]|nr:peptidoglycan DD-metalloendopeptidase family protein [Myxococcales bacterium]